MFAEFCHHHHNQFRTFSSSQKETLLSGSHVPSLSPWLPSPRQPLFYFLCLQICLFWTFCVMASGNMISFVTGFFSSIIFSRFICVVAWISTPFLLYIYYIILLNNIPSYHILFISSVGGRLGYFYFLAIMNNAAINICIQASKWIFVFI